MKNRITLLVLIIAACSSFLTSCHNSGTDNNKVVSSDDKTAIDTSKSAQADSTIVEKKDTAQTTTAPPAKPSLTVIVDNLKSPDAPIVMGVYGTDNKFPDPTDQLKEYHFKPVNGKLEAKIIDLPYGEFAIALYQDINSNGHIDKNGIGIPKEPYAFSNNYRPTIKAPSFDDCKFAYSGKTNTITISLLK